MYECVFVSVCLSVCVSVCVRQLVTSIPTRSLPRGMTLGSASNQEVEEIQKEIEEEEDAAAAAARRGQILWVRGLNRLQHQVFVLVHRYSTFSFDFSSFFFPSYLSGALA